MIGAWTAADLPRPTRDLETAKTDIDTFGYCLLAEALEPERLAAVRTRLVEQALAERQAGVGYFDGGPAQNWGSFRDAAGRPRSDAFTEAGGGVNQRLWMLVNKGRVFVDLLSHAAARAVIDHVLGDEYILSSFIANIANPGGLPMKLHTDAWWAPVPTRRDRRPLPVGSITRERFDELAAGPPAMIAPPACCNIMWMLDEFAEANGATRVVPGSHLFGRQPHPERDKGVATVAAEAPAGTAMVFEGRLWHGTGANRSNGARMGLLTTHCGPQYRPQENFTVGTRPEVLADASPDLRALLGFKVWWGYGRIENPAVDFIRPGETSLGEMYPE